MRQVQDLVVVPPGERVRDKEGRWRDLGRDRTVRGLLRRKALAGQRREVRPEDMEQAFAEVPIDAHVPVESTVYALDPTPDVEGDWSVVAVTRGRSFWRLELRRPGKR